MSEKIVIFDTGIASHVGLVRQVNEDSHFCRPGIGLWAVSDGMGGHQAGKMASTMVAEGLAGVAAKPDASDLVAACRDALIATNGHLRETAKVMGLNQAGATVVLLIIHSGRYFCLWCGDSRIYRIRSKAIAQLTRDHSEVQELIGARSALRREEAKTWPRAATSSHGQSVARSTRCRTMIDGEIEVGDIFVLCSDGADQPRQRRRNRRDLRERRCTVRRRSADRLDARSRRQGQCHRRRRPLPATRTDRRRSDRNGPRPDWCCPHEYAHPRFTHLDLSAGRHAA